MLEALPRESAGFGLLAVGPDGTIGLIRQNPVVFALHASPDAPAVDIYAGETALTTNLAFGQLSTPAAGAAGRLRPELPRRRIHD